LRVPRLPYELGLPDELGMPGARGQVIEL